MLMVVNGMDDTTSTGGNHDGRRSKGSTGMSAGIEETLRDFWATRPQRPQRGRKIAGVAEGIGLRYGIDPVVVRVAFAVMSIYGGVGIPLYLLGWLLLPREGDESSAAEALLGKGRSSVSVPMTAVLAVALLLAGTVLIHGAVDTYVALALAVGALFLLHRNRGHYGARDSVGSPPRAADAAATSAADTNVADTGAVTAHEAATPEAPSDEGASERSRTGDDPRFQQQPPHSWDLPEPGAQPQRAPLPVRHRSQVTGATILAAILAGILCTLLAPYSDGWLTLPRGLGLILAVIGLGLVVGLFLRAGRGLVWIALPVGLVAVALTGPSVDHWAGAGSQEWHPTSTSGVRSHYWLAVGNLTVDLTRLQPGGSTPVITKVDVGAGNVRVRVPSDMRVEAHCAAGLGTVRCLDQRARGPRAATGATVDGTADRPGDGPSGAIVLDAGVGSGTVEVTRG